MSGGAARLATPDDWCNILREFADEKPAFLQVWLDVTADMINVSCWKAKSCAGHVFASAHFLTVGTDKEKGPVTEKQIDKLRIKYAEVQFGEADADFAGTRYGRLYLAMRDSLLVPGIVGRRILNRPPGC